MTALIARASDAQAADIPQTDTDTDTETEPGMLSYVFAIHEAAGALPGAGAGYESGSAPYRLALADAEGGLFALAQDVPAGAFSEQALRDRLADPETLEAFARTHHAMVTAAAAAGPVVPLPLATLYTDRHRAAQTLTARAAQFRLVLDRTRGMAEWAVKVYAAPDGAAREAGGAVPPPADPAPGPPPAPGAGAGAGAGRAYLDRVRTRRQDQQARYAAVSAEAARIDEAVRRVAGGAVRRRPHGAQVTGRHRVQILNGAYLVDVRRADRLHDVIDALRAHAAGVEIEVSGPWVPYSFAAVGEDHDL